MPRPLALLLLALGACAGPVQQAAVTAPPADTRWLSCVPYARERSSIALSGDGWQWWDAAAGRYARAQRPEPGAVLVFARTGRLRDGHVAVVAEVLNARQLRVDHANWESGRGQILTGQLVEDVSPGNDWTAVRVWFPPAGQMGITVFPTLGFVLPRPAEGAVRAT